MIFGIMIHRKIRNKVICEAYQIYIEYRYGVWNNGIEKVNLAKYRYGVWNNGMQV